MRFRGDVSSLDDDSTRLGRGRETSTGVAAPGGSGEKLPGARGTGWALAGCIVEEMVASRTGCVTSWRTDKIGPLSTASFRRLSSVGLETDVRVMEAGRGYRGRDGYMGASRR